MRFRWRISSRDQGGLENCRIARPHRLPFAKQCRFMERSVSTPVLRILQWTAQSVTGAIAYYACEALNDYFVFRDGVNPVVAQLFFFFFPSSAAIAFILLTIAWHRILPKGGNVRFPEVPMILGALILMPIYFEFASHLIYEPRPINPHDLMKHLLSYYVIFPLAVIDIGSYTFSLHAFALAALSAVITGYVMRKRKPALGT